MLHNVLSYVKSFIQALLIILVTTYAIDWWRKPHQPLGDLATPMVTLNRDHLTLTQISQNQIAVLYFWGSWCGICQYTSPNIEQLYQEGTPVLSFAIKSGTDQTLHTYLKQQQLSFPTINDSEGVLANHWQINVTPTIIVIKNGRMLHATTGFSSYWGLRIRLFLSHLTN